MNISLDEKFERAIAARKKGEFFRARDIANSVNMTAGSVGTRLAGTEGFRFDTKKQMWEKL